MAQEYIRINSQSNLGEIQLNKSVFTSIAANVIEEDENVVLDNSKTFKNAVNTKVVDGKLSLVVAVKVNHGANVADVCADLQNKIFESISYMTDFNCDSIEIQVTGFVF